MAEKLTYAQNLAVNNRGGKVLVSAAAGSGKTKVLVDRLLTYLTDPVRPANIDDFLIITYTKAAAAELRGKIAAKLSEHIALNPGNRHLQRQMQRLYLTKISTVHAFCADILREYAYRLDIAPDFRVGDENECLQLRTRAMEITLEEAYESLDESPSFQAFLDTQGLGRNDSLVPEIIEQVYDSAMCHLDPQAWYKKCIEDAAASRSSELLETPWGHYLCKSLFASLDGYIFSMERCAEMVSGMEGMEKPTAVLKDSILQLRQLRDAKSWDEIVARKKIDYGRLVFPKKYDDPSVTEQVKAIRNACKVTLEKKLRWFNDDAAKVLEDMLQASAATSGLIDLVEHFSENFSRLKKAARLLDFSDLEHRMLDLLRGKKRTGITVLAKEISSRFLEIMVDEYQDSNGVQDAIFEALTSERQNLFMVGDVKQSIYQFRLADPGIFLRKYATYKAAEDAQQGEGRKILLSSNFRSGGGVISAVNAVFSDCMSEAVGGLDYGEREALQEGIPHIAILEPEVELHGIAVQEDTYGEEATFTANRIRQLLDGTHYIRQGDSLRPICPEDIVILLRSPGSVGFEYELALAQAGIPCAGSDSGDLLLAEEIGTLRSLLEVISNPRQDIPLLAVLASPVFSFEADDLAMLRSGNPHCSIYDAVVRSELPKAKAFLQVLTKLRKNATMLTLPELLALIFRVTKLDAIYSAKDDGADRKQNLQDFYQLAANFSAAGASGVDRFLDHLAALESRGIPKADVQPAGCVTIMSIHKSKGLEFPVVFLCGLSRRFNREDLRQQVLCHKELGLGLSCVDHKNRVRYPTLSRNAITAVISDESISEELRVLYVAMTRARDRLIMTYASQNLESDIQSIVSRMDLSDAAVMTSEVSCPGEWILFSALKRAEAGELFALGGRPAATRISDYPWYITVSEQRILTENAVLPETKPVEKTGAFPHIAIQQFHYTHEAATKTPSKRTATQKKGRLKDQEAAEYTAEETPVFRRWRKPSFVLQTPDGASYGNAMHAVMQYISFDACSDEASVQAEICRLVRENFITAEQGEMADSGKIAKFFQTELGEKIRGNMKVLREFKFSILDDAANYEYGLDGEKVLLQGVVDCALIEDDGITVIDFKTDTTSKDSAAQVLKQYSAQIETYAEVLCRIFEKPLKAKALYLFSLGEFMYL